MEKYQNQTERSKLGNHRFHEIINIWSSLLTIFSNISRSVGVQNSHFIPQNDLIKQKEYMLNFYMHVGYYHRSYLLKSMREISLITFAMHFWHKLIMKIHWASVRCLRKLSKQYWSICGLKIHSLNIKRKELYIVTHIPLKYALISESWTLYNEGDVTNKYLETMRY